MEIYPLDFWVACLTVIKWIRFWRWVADMFWDWLVKEEEEGKESLKIFSF